MDWKIDREPARPVPTRRELPLEGAGLSALIRWTTLPDHAGTQFEETVSVECRAYFADAADAERFAAAIAAEWPTFCQYVADRVAAAKAKEASNG